MLSKFKKYYKNLNISSETWLYIVFVIIAVFVVVWAINYYSNLRKPICPAINAVPPQPAALINFNDAIKLFAKLSYESNICKAIYEIEDVQKFFKEVEYLNSVISTDNYARNIVAKNTFLIALYPQNNDETESLYLFSLPDNKQQANIKKFLSKLTGSLSHKKYTIDKDINLYNIDFLNYNKKIFWSDNKGVFAASFDSTLVVRAVEQCNKPSYLILDKNFSRVYYTAGKKVYANVFLNYKTFTEAFSNVVSAKYCKSITPLNKFASWSGLDFSFKNQSFILNGFTSANDTSLFLDLFNEQTPSNIRLTSFAPYNTSVLLYFGIKDFTSFYPNLKKFLNSNNLHNDNYRNIITKCNSEGIDIENILTNLIGNEYAFVSNTISSKNNTDNFFAVLNVADSISAREMLRVLVQKFPDESCQLDTANSNIYYCGCIDLPPLAPAFFGNIFSPVKKNCFILYKDFLIIGNSINALKKEVAFIESGKTLASNQNFTNFSDNITNEANVFLYCNIRKSIDFISQYLNNKLQQKIKDNRDILTNFEALALQFNKKDNLFYTGICLKHNPAYVDESPALWEVLLNTNVASKPHIFYDKTGNLNNIQIFDIYNNLYMINKTGEIVWKTQLPEKIISQIYEVDINNNGEKCYAFNSEKKIYILNNTGEILKGYPVKLPSPAASGMSVFDYDNKLEYRFVIPLKNKRIINLTYKGKKVNGWNIPILDSYSETGVTHYRIAGNDLLVTSSAEGTVYIINRRGGVIFNSTGKFKIANNTNIFADEDNLIFAATNGKIYNVNASKKFKAQIIDKYSLSVNFVLSDINNDGKKEYIFIDKGELKIYNSKQKLVYQYDESPKLSRFIYISGSKNKPVLIIPDVDSNLQFFNYKGKINTELTVKGNKMFTSGFLSDDNSINFITTNNNCVFYYYLIKNI